MDEYFTKIMELKTSYQKDLTYLTEHFTEELLPQFKKILTNHYNQQLTKNVKNLEKHAEFDIRVLGPILASIISIFEGHLFVFQDIINNEGDDGYCYQHVNYIMLIDATKEKESYTKAEISQLLNKEQVFLIKQQHISSRTKEFTKSWFEYTEKFYTVYDAYIDGEQNIKSLLSREHFPYLKEFMDYVIAYRLRNDLQEIDNNILLSLRKEFINSHLDEIQKRNTKYDKLRETEIKEQTDTLMSMLANEQKGRKLLLEKINHCEL